MQGNLSSLARLAVVCVAAVAVFVAWLATPGTANIGVSFFYAVSVGLAAWWWGWRGAVLAIVASAGLYALGAEIQAVAHFWPTLIVRLAAFYVVAFVAIALKRRFAALEHSAEELEAIRAALTPARLPDLRNVDAAAVFVPSELGVSGDFYLLASGPDGSTVAIVGDVVGHGPKAARLATFVRERLAALAASTSDPAELLTLANVALAERPRRGRQLVSATCVRYSPDESLLTWASSGHPPPLALPGIEEMEVEGDTFLLGAQADLELRNASVALEEGEGVLVYTDGATDVRRDGALLGLGGLSRLLAPLAGLPARGLADRAEEAILAWAEGTIRDDLCLLVLRPRR
jgi:serine phosphatase RsbU (regulator of sigma subunit)